MSEQRATRAERRRATRDFVRGFGLSGIAQILLGAVSAELDDRGWSEDDRKAFLWAVTRRMAGSQEPVQAIAEPERYVPHVSSLRRRIITMLEGWIRRLKGGAKG